MTNTFIGIDLAWQSERHPSGASVLHGDADEAHLVALAPPLRALQAVKEWISPHFTSQSVIAVDAPLVIRNVTGLRGCERDMGVRYGARHASCHASNLRLYPNAASVALASWLQGHGFSHAPAGFKDRAMLKVYPHAAMVALFDLPFIIKYKKGRIADRRTGLRTMQATLRRLTCTEVRLALNEPLEAVLAQPLDDLRGGALKSYEDTLDAVFCAYLAYYAWRRGDAGSELMGTREDGYIVNPRLVSAKRSVSQHEHSVLTNNAS